MKEYSVLMALVDFIPVILFAVSAAMMQKEFYDKMKRVTFVLFSGGTVSIILAGGLKALYKLLYALGVCDFAVLSSMFMPLQAIGFMLAGVSLVMMVSHSRKNTSLMAAAPAAYSGTMMFVAFMVTGLTLMSVSLAVYAKRKKKYLAVILFVVTFICLLGMGYLSSRDFSKASFNWIAEAVNVAGQICLTGGIMMIKSEPETQQ